MFGTDVLVWSLPLCEIQQPKYPTSCYRTLWPGPHLYKPDAVCRAIKGTPDVVADDWKAISGWLFLACCSHHSSPDLRRTLPEHLIVFSRTLSLGQNSDARVLLCCIWTLSWASVIYVTSCFAFARRESNPSIQCCFSQRFPVLETLQWHYTTNHFEIRVKRGCNVTLIYHTCSYMAWN